MPAIDPTELARMTDEELAGAKHTIGLLLNDANLRPLLAPTWDELLAEGRARRDA